MREVQTVFISYRRDDTRHLAGRLADRLSDRFRLFMDVSGIEPGADFRETLRQAVGQCDVFLAIIGNQWLSVVDEDGRQRLSQPDDWVVQEIAAALERGIRVIPVLVDGAQMPGVEDLPPRLAALASRQAFTLHHESFPFDVERLIPAIEGSMRRPRSPTWPERLRRHGHSPLPRSTVAPVAGNHREPSGEAASQNVVGPRSRLLIGLTALVVTIGVGAIAVAIFASGPLLSRSSQPSLASASPTTESPASSASPAPPLKITPSGSPRRQASPSPTPSGSSRNFLVPGDSVTFEHHVVTVLAIERPRPDEVWVKAKVCVRKLPPHPQHGRTRISWAPWKIHSGVHTFDPGSAPSSAHSSNTYPSERTYRVGDCAAGWIPFPRVSSGERIGSISYTNQLGDTATWHTSI